MSEIQLKIEKSRIPILWLDTSVIFNMTKWKKGETLDSITNERMEYLHSRIYDLTRQKKLICPRADQDEEIWVGRSECLEMMLSLSLGIRTKYRERVKDFQTRRFMEAFLYGQDEIKMSYCDFFHDDPIEQLNDVPNMLVNVDLGLIESGNEIRERKRRQLEWLEDLRQRFVEKGVSYEEQLNKEYNADLDALTVLLLRFLSGQLSPLETWSFFDIVSQWFHSWDELGGEPDDLLKFFTSQYYKAIPIISISSRISVKLITGKDPIKPSHSMDIYHASSAIPYIDFFITDRQMKHILEELNIGEEYQTVIGHIGDSDQIEAFFNRL